MPAKKQTEPKKLYYQIGVLVVILSLIMLFLIRQNGGSSAANQGPTLPPVQVIQKTPDNKYFDQGGLQELRRRSNHKLPGDSDSGDNPFDRVR